MRLEIAATSSFTPLVPRVNYARDREQDALYAIERGLLKLNRERDGNAQRQKRDKIFVGIWVAGMPETEKKKKTTLAWSVWNNISMFHSRGTNIHDSTMCR